MAFDENLKENLKIIKSMVKDDWDGLIYLGGLEGAGKSVLALQVGKFLDPTLSIERVVFDPQDFIDVINSAKPGQAIVYDEAQDAFESTRKDKIAMTLKSVLTRIRSKNLFIIIVSPHFWSINKYLFCHRSRAFIRVYAKRQGRKMVRGFYSFYGGDKKHQLYLKGKRWENVNVVKPDFSGRFTNELVVNWKEYNAKKDRGTEGVMGKSSMTNTHRSALLQRNILLHNLSEFYTMKELAHMILARDDYVASILKETELEELEEELDKSMVM